MHGDLPGGPETYMDGEFDNTFVLASGSSFYKQCFPPESIDLGFCATAMHWLTNTPAGGIPDALHSAASLDGPTKVRAVHLLHVSAANGRDASKIGRVAGGLRGSGEQGLGKHPFAARQGTQERYDEAAAACCSLLQLPLLIALLIANLPGRLALG